MVCIPTTIKNNTDIYISLFGQLQISTSSGTLKESDYNSPRISQLLTYLLISNEKHIHHLKSHKLFGQMIQLILPKI